MIQCHHIELTFSLKDTEILLRATKLTLEENEQVNKKLNLHL